MRRPANWHDLSYDEQQRFLKLEREYRDLEYDRELDRRSQEQAARSLSDAKRQLQVAQSERASEVSNLNDCLEDANNEIALAHEFLKFKGLYEEFDEWASYRRSE